MSLAVQVRGSASFGAQHLILRECWGGRGKHRAGTIPAVMASIKPTLFSHSSPSLTCWRMSITGLEGLGEVRGGRTG